MKSLIRFLFVLAIAIAFGFSHTANAGPGRVIIEKLPKLGVPRTVSFEHWSTGEVEPVSVYKGDEGKITVSYWVYDSKKQISVNFITDSKGDLLSFRIVQVDTTVFSWYKYDGELMNNKVTTDVEAWKRLFKKKVALNRSVEVL